MPDTYRVAARESYGISVQSLRESNVVITGGVGGYVPPTAFSLWDVLMVLSATLGGYVGSWIALTALARLLQ